MERMYAPWRLAFIEGKEGAQLPLPTGCIFCDYPREVGAAGPESISVKAEDGSVVAHDNPHRSAAAFDRARLVLTVRDHAFVILNKYPYTNGHVMVVPRLHTSKMEEMEPDAFASLHALLHETVAAVRKAYAPHGMNIGMNMGRAAGAGIDEHIHYHVVPRWNGDTNFMPVFSDARVISEGITDTYDRLLPLLRTAEDDAERFIPDAT